MSPGVLKIEIAVQQPSNAVVKALMKLGALGPNGADLMEGVHLDASPSFYTRDHEAQKPPKMAFDAAPPMPASVTIIVTLAASVAANVVAAELERLLHPPSSTETQTITVERHEVIKKNWKEVWEKTVTTKRQER